MNFHIQKTKAIPLIMFAFERATGIIAPRQILSVQTDLLRQDDFTQILALYQSALRFKMHDGMASALASEDDRHIAEHNNGPMPSEIFRSLDDIVTDEHTSTLEKFAAAEAIVLAVGYLLGYQAKGNIQTDRRFQ